ncbi:hypothetical protein COV28_00460 [candidate division WWE3 bacterium CG10_big_fil_rev_8_21_14_0_10_48_23]|nr:MAG: hypothetical protein COY35_02220 [candidate division WWE3 bacterium CG_4_10_14_0_2_um_filter_47_8]PJE52287.1 MAG: hypothetical protein COV28_00460 [candidate division WWE3 bacterium CG10_big_fil_rev_8_21_14_0_10_48_23]
MEDKNRERYNSDRSEELQGAKRRYNWLWKQMPIQSPEIWPSWEICRDFVGRRCLEIGCGNYPRIPLENSYFLDISESAVQNLKAKGLNAYLGTAEKLPFEDNFFDLVVAWDVMEHVPDDQKAFAEVSRVLKFGGYFLFSVPLKKNYFGPWDAAVGHLRRYEAAELNRILEEDRFRVVKFQGQNLLKHIHKIPFFVWVLSKLANPPLRQYQFGLPVPSRFRVFLIRGYAFLGRLLAIPWRTGQLDGVKSEANITILCQKV